MPINNNRNNNDIFSRYVRKKLRYLIWVNNHIFMDPIPEMPDDFDGNCKCEYCAPFALGNKPPTMDSFKNLRGCIGLHKECEHDK